MLAEGVVFETRVDAGRDVSVNYLRRTFDAVVVAAGSRVPREIPLPGRELSGVHPAMDYLTAQNRRVAGDALPPEPTSPPPAGGSSWSAAAIPARTASARRGARPRDHPDRDPPRAAEGARRRQPLAPLAADPADRHLHEEGCTRLWGNLTTEILGTPRAASGAALRQGRLGPGRRRRAPVVPGSPRLGVQPAADFVVFAMGFVHTEHSALVTDFGLELNPGACLLTDADLMTSAPGIFAAGDCVLGARLIVTAIDQGRRARPRRTAGCEAL
jgi:NADPH-dependent glutamate synthase beta subunit-like oxidoreductase